MLCLSMIFVSCNQKPKVEMPIVKELPKTAKVSPEKAKPEPPEPCAYKKTNKTIKNTFPFNKATDIALVKYAKINARSQNAVLIHNGKLDVDSIIDQKISLNKIQKDSLFSLLYYRGGTPDTSMQRVASRCGYSPLHGIAFYQGKRTIAYIELCFSCGKHNNGELKLPFNSCRSEGGNWCLLSRFFFDAGIDKIKPENCW